MGQGCRIKIETGVYFAIALALLVLPLFVFVSFLIAVTVHEMCHWMALHWTGVKIYGLSIGPFGAVIETEPIESGREVLCAAAGPLGSLILASLYSYIPVIGVIGLVQGCFNLLPLYPMDGGRMLKGILELLKIPGKEKIIFITQVLTMVWIIICTIYGFGVWNLGWGAMIFCGAMLLRTFPGKTPCKDGPFGVQ